MVNRKLELPCVSFDTPMTRPGILRAILSLPLKKTRFSLLCNQYYQVFMSCTCKQKSLREARQKTWARQTAVLTQQQYPPQTVIIHRIITDKIVQNLQLQS